MAGVDGILGIAIQAGADELRLGTGRAPKIFAKGAPKRLVIPETSEGDLRHLLGPILSAERERELRRAGTVELAHATPRLGTFRVTLALRREETTSAALAFDAVFVVDKGGGAPSPTPTIPAPAPMPEPTEIHFTPPSVTMAEGDPGRLSALLAHAAGLGASDLHLASGEPPTVRIDGALRTLEELEHVDVASLVAPHLTSGSRAALDDGRSAELCLDHPDTGRFRINIYRTSHGLALAARVLRRAAPPLESLRLPVALDDLAAFPNGLVLVCGPTGSGKSTTVSALAREALRRRRIALITLEDPIEYVLLTEPGRGLVRQRQIGTDVRDFATGLRDALREDPDVLMIGEMRDPESISLALTAAETGHLVLTTLHSRSAASAIERIVDSYPPERANQVRVQLAASLRAIVVQRLLPRARGSGRVVALEVLRVSHAVANVIREGRTEQIATAMQSGRTEGMLPLERSLADLVRSREIDQEVACDAANDPSALAGYLAPP